MQINLNVFNIKNTNEVLFTLIFAKCTFGADKTRVPSSDEDDNSRQVVVTSQGLKDGIWLFLSPETL